MASSSRYTTIYLLLLISLGYVATDIYLPSLPALSTYFDASDNEVQMTLFSYLFSFSLSPLIFGPLSDHIGRKKVILGGIFAGILATAGCLFAQNIYEFIAARFLQGFGLGAVLISSRAIIQDLFVGKAMAKQISLVTMLLPLIMSIAPTLGGVLQEKYQWHSVFIFLMSYMILLFFIVLITPESLKKLHHEKISRIFSNYRAHLNNRPFLLFGVNYILPSFGLFAYLTTSPFLFQEVIGLSPIEYGSLALYAGGVILFTSYLNLKLIHYFPLTKLICVGASIVVFSGCLLMFFHFMNILTTWSFLIPCLFFFTCMPLCLANSASKSLSFVKSHFGTAIALLTTIQFLAGSLGSLLFSLISDNTALPLAIVFLLVGVVSLINLKNACALEKKPFA